jgi:hypothetical protein
MGWELWLFLGVEGLDTQIYWGFRGKKMRGVPPLRLRLRSG